ncbi:MAG: UDP-N-acetyl-D-galactosamine dehydrogenase, partial [Flavobacteriales bacterium]
MIYEKLRNKEATMAVVGLGYVGLPIALEFAREIKVLGFDINAQRVELMKKGIDP